MPSFSCLKELFAYKNNSTNDDYNNDDDDDVIPDYVWMDGSELCSGAG